MFSFFKFKTSRIRKLYISGSFGLHGRCDFTLATLGYITFRNIRARTEKAEMLRVLHGRRSVSIIGGANQ